MSTPEQTRNPQGSEERYRVEHDAWYLEYEYSDGRLGEWSVGLIHSNSEAYYRDEGGGFPRLVSMYNTTSVYVEVVSWSYHLSPQETLDFAMRIERAADTANLFQDVLNSVSRFHGSHISKEANH